MTLVLAEAEHPFSSAPFGLSLFLLEAGGSPLPVQAWRGPSLDSSLLNDVECVACDLAALPASVRRVAAAVAIAGGRAPGRSFGALKKAVARIRDAFGKEVLRYDLDEDFAGAEGVLIGEFHRSEDGWRLRPLGEACPSDEAGLRQAYARIAAEPPPGRREDGSVGFPRPIRLSLDWRRTQAPPFEFGALVEDRQGRRWAAQRSESAFLKAGPLSLVQLTGSRGDGLEIDDDGWPDLRRALVYAILRDGADCSGLEGVLRLRAPALPEREIPVRIEDAAQRILALTLLENVDGALKVSPQRAAFPAQEPMDRAYGWGLTWRRSGG